MKVRLIEEKDDDDDVIEPQNDCIEGGYEEEHIDIKEEILQSKVLKRNLKPLTKMLIRYLGIELSNLLVSNLDQSWSLRTN